ncbi:hypothetical protein MKX01_030283 [Papaver californicum]|nr:hypothetical protein MKX01_030283 [Papaver californicum]
MEEKSFDIVLVPLGLLMMVIYHTWLFFTILHQPKRTVVGLNALSRKRWVSSMMSDPNKNGVLAVQTIRNSIMASTLLATTAITMRSIIGVFVSSTTDTKTSALIYGNTSRYRIESILHVIPLFLWIFGPIPMFACCCILLSVLYFRDTTSSITRELHSHHMKHDDNDLKMKDSVELSQVTLV